MVITISLYMSTYLPVNQPPYYHHHHNLCKIPLAAKESPESDSVLIRPEQLHPTPSQFTLPKLVGLTNTCCVHACMHIKSLQLCLTLHDPMDYSPPGPSVHGILQARILEWVAMLSSRGSSQPRDQTCVSPFPALQADFIPTEPPGKPQIHATIYKIDKHQGPAVRCRKLYSISYNNL